MFVPATPCVSPEPPKILVYPGDHQPRQSSVANFPDFENLPLHKDHRWKPTAYHIPFLLGPATPSAPLNTGHRNTLPWGRGTAELALPNMIGQLQNGEMPTGKTMGIE